MEYTNCLIYQLPLSARPASPEHRFTFLVLTSNDFTKNQKKKKYTIVPTGTRFFFLSQNGRSMASWHVPLHENSMPYLTLIPASSPTVPPSPGHCVRLTQTNRLFTSPMQAQSITSSTSSTGAHINVAFGLQVFVRPYKLEQKNAMASTSTTECNINNIHTGDAHPIVTSVSEPTIPKQLQNQSDFIESLSGPTQINHARHQYISMIPNAQRAPTRQLSYTRAPTAPIHNSLAKSHSLSHSLTVSRQDRWTSQHLRFQTRLPPNEQQSYSLLRFLEGGVDDPWNSECPAIITPRVLECDLDEMDKRCGVAGI